MINILFVCTGNTCRSPMAEGIFNALASSRGLDAAALSCGIFAGMPQNASENAVKAASEYGADISGHLSKPVSFDLVENSDKIYCMTKNHLEYLERMYPEFIKKMATLMEDDVDDPYSGTLEGYKKTAKQIYEALLEIIGQI